MGKLITSLIPLFAILLSDVTHADEDRRDDASLEKIETADQDLSCMELDAEISRLIPLTYNTNPDFYTDPANGYAIWGSVFWAPAISYFGYSGVTQYYGQKDMAEAEQRMATLRHLKAQRRCYQR